MEANIAQGLMSATSTLAQNFETQIMEIQKQVNERKPDLLEYYKSK